MRVQARYATFELACDARRDERFGNAALYQVAWQPDDAWRAYPWALVVKTSVPESAGGRPGTPASIRYAEDETEARDRSVTLSPATVWFRDNILKPKGISVG